ncbi:MAG: MFS transporter [Patescibacteria group bacterium]|jgi:MFS family permease
MFKKIKFQRPHYFSQHPSQGLKDLYWSVGLKDFALAAVTIFEPIYLYTLGYSLQSIMLFYLIIYGAYVLLLPLFGRVISRIGLEHSIFYSQFVLIFYFILLFSIPQVGLLFYIAPLFCALYKSFYWPAYHADFVSFSQDGQRGREVGGLETLSVFVYILGPLIGGAIIEWTSFGVLFFCASILFIISSIPLFRIKEIHGKMDYSYSQAWRQLFDKEHRRYSLAYFGFGEEMIVLTLWPVFIFIVVKNYLEIGALIAVTTFVTSIIVLYLGRASDKYRRDKIMRSGIIIYFFTWLLRGFASVPWHVFGLDASSRFSKEMLFVPLQVITYSKAKEIGALSYAVFFEQSLAVAKFFAALLAIIIIYIFSSPWVPLFILAAIFSLFYLFLKDVKKVATT